MQNNECLQEHTRKTAHLTYCSINEEYTTYTRSGASGKCDDDNDSCANKPSSGTLAIQPIPF